jgi:hypothetical protein
MALHRLIAARAVGLSSASTTTPEHQRPQVRSQIILLTGLPEVAYGLRQAVSLKVGVLRSSYGEQAFIMKNEHANMRSIVQKWHEHLNR